MRFGVDQRLIILAALLHDVGTAPFGHSVQYALELQGYEHEALHNILTGVHESRPGEFIYRHTPMEQIYLGTLRRLNSLLSKEDLKAIDDMIAGRGPFGPLISGSIHIGITIIPPPEVSMRLSTGI